MRSVDIPTAAPYRMLIGEGVLARAGEEIRSVHRPCRVCVVTDSRVGPLYAPELEKALAEAGFEAFRFTFPEGEASKTIGTFAEAMRFMFASGLTRGDLAVTLGGGVAGDLGGFAAACYQRGIPFVQVTSGGFSWWL